jgi:hypothetical protein
MFKSIGKGFQVFGVGTLLIPSFSTLCSLKSVMLAARANTKKREEQL